MGSELPAVITERALLSKRVLLICCLRINLISQHGG